jgi:tetratricopeptide (TPR) repeat protein
MPTVKFVANPSKEDGMPESVQETVRTHLDHGRACLDTGKYDDAIADYTKAIALDPNVALAYTNRGLAYYRKGEYERAIADHSKAIAIDPNHANAYYNRGVAYEQKGDKDQAIADYDKVLEINPSDQDAKVTLELLGVTP